MNTTVTNSQTTQADLNSILETLDQRLSELEILQDLTSESKSGKRPEWAMAKEGEIDRLKALRTSVLKCSSGELEDAA